MNTTDSEDHRRASIALNNAAVTLLRRGYVREAIETLSDAVKIMRSAIASTDAKNLSRSSPLTGDIVRQALDRSSQRACRFGGLRDSVAAANMPILQPISSQHNPSRILDLLTSHECPSAEVAFPITIEPVDFDNETSNDEADFEAATILYNYGIAINCLASSVCHPFVVTGESLELRGKARQILKMAGALVGKANDGNPLSSNMCSGLASRVLLLRAMLLHSLIDVAIHFGLDVEYEVYSCEIQLVFNAVEVFKALIPVVDHHIAAAA